MSELFIRYLEQVRMSQSFNVPDLRPNPIEWMSKVTPEQIAQVYGYPNGAFENEPELPADVQPEPEQPSESEQDRLWKLLSEIAQG